MNPQDLWNKYKNLAYTGLPDNVKQVAQQCVEDWYGCALAGSNEPLAQILRDHFGHRSGGCSVIGSDLKLDAATAALLNGASGHALDFDDTGSQTLCHSTAPVMPAVLAVAEERGCKGTDMLSAFVVGVEVEGRIAQAMGTDHYARGWHSTATFGTFGAAAAVAHLLKLDDEKFGIAMGLAASHAGGVKANFGTMTKPFHPGRAAESGVNSAFLAAAGFSANPDAVFGNQGFIMAASNGADRSEVLREIEDEWLILGTLFKYHAACHLTHSVIENVAKLRAQRNVDNLSSLTVTVNPSLLDVCGIPDPKTGLEGKFSLRCTAALSLLGADTSSAETFVDEVVCREDVQQMINKVKVETDGALKQFQSKVVWGENNQQTHEAFEDLAQPATNLVAQGAKIRQKFASLVALSGGDVEQQRRVVDSLVSESPVHL